jgi:hypothetical protein
MGRQRPRRAQEVARRLKATGVALALMAGAGGARAQATGAPGTYTTSTTWTVTIVLPPRLVAGQPATLAVLGTDGKLAHGVQIDVGQDVHVRTDPIGRAYFTVPTGANYLIAKSQGSYAAALVDAQAPPVTAKSVTVGAAVSLQDSFPICGGGFRGDAESNRVTISGEPALVLAASPECLVVLASTKNKPGTAAISVQAPEGEWDIQTTLVSLRNEPPDPPLVAQKKSRMGVLAEGSTQPVLIRVRNESPEVLHFVHGDDQVLRTSGGAANQAQFEVEAMRSGNYSFQARIVAPANPAEAERYLDAAIPLAGKDFGKQVKKLSERLKRHPRDIGRATADLDAMLNVAIAGELRTLLAAARDCL